MQLVSFALCLACADRQPHAHARDKNEYAEVLDEWLQDGSGADDLRFDPKAWCPEGTSLPGSAVPVIPPPRQVFISDEHIQIGRLGRIVGADEDELTEIQNIGDETTWNGKDTLEAVLYPKEVWQELREACTLPENLGAYLLVTRHSGNRGEVHIFAGDREGRFYALKTLRQLLRSGSLPLLSILDYPEVPLRGVIEGFYGRPWSDEERLQVLPALADLKFNIYAYAPKDDWAISVLWKLPLPEDDARRIKTVAQVAHSQRMKVCWEIRPVLFLSFSSNEDLGIMIEKARVIRENGADCIILAFDDTDMPLNGDDAQAYDSFIEAAVDFANRFSGALVAEMPDLLLIFVPRTYWLEAKGAHEELAYIGAHLNPIWKVAWTGNQVVSKTISLEDAQMAAALIRRPPILGDNFPVTDDATKTGIVNLGPLTGRAPELPAHLAGIAFNASPLPFASLVGLATAADFSWNPETYDPAAATRRASVWLAGLEGAWALEQLMATNQIAPFAPSPAPALENAIAAFWGEYISGVPEGEAKATLEAMFEQFRLVPEGLLGSNVSQGLLGELMPWAEELAQWGEAGLMALDLLGQKAAGAKPNLEAVAQLQALYDALQAGIPKPTGDVMPVFITTALDFVLQ